MKIGILGIGGIGGLVGSALAKNYENIYFISRGESLKAIKKDGLTLKSDKLGTFTVTPALATENAEEIGLLDVLIISTKNYGLESACRQCQSIINKNTIIIPLLNGVNISKDVEKFLKEGEFAEGCIYGFSSIEKAGVIRHIGDLCNIYFGFQDGRSNEKCLTTAELIQFFQIILWLRFGKSI
ncbi:MAG: ketopantoate reductase family protein [Anaerotignaceae bacterium]